MTEGNYKHKLAAILSADVVGYSRLMAEDEVATIRSLSACRDKIGTHVEANSGRVVDFTGDNTLSAAYYGSGHNEKAITSAKEVLKSDKNNLDAQLILAGASAALDRQEEASRAAAEIQRIQPGFTIGKYAATQPYRDPAKLAQVTDMLQKAGLH
jgi:class 3 adenylate cyclase